MNIVAGDIYRSNVWNLRTVAFDKLKRDVVWIRRIVWVIARCGWMCRRGRQKRNEWPDERTYLGQMLITKIADMDAYAAPAISDGNV